MLVTSHEWWMTSRELSAGFSRRPEDGCVDEPDLAAKRNERMTYDKNQVTDTSIAPAHTTMSAAEQKGQNKKKAEWGRRA